MSRLLALAFVVVCLSAAGPAARAQTTAKPTAMFEKLLAEYAAGKVDVLASTVVDEWQQMDFRYSLAAVLAQKNDPKLAPPWTKARAAFLLEAAIFASTHFRQDVVPAVSAGRLMVMNRPSPLGLDPAEDAFELLWHQIALALLQRMMASDAQQVYLVTLERRYLGKSPAQAQPVFNPRFVLDRLIADEQAAYRLESAASGQAMTTRLTPLVKPTDKSKLAALLHQAVKSSEEAITLPSVAIEASLRRSALFIKLGQPDAALSAVQRLDRKLADDVQLYWLTLLEARALQELKRLPEAERAYQEAAGAWPEAAAPITGLALVLFDMNRRDEAVAAAAALRAQNPTGKDPWWNYIAADSRFVNRWRDDLREMIK